MNILVLCTGNSCRSQMAEAILQQELGDKASVYSAGLDPQDVNPSAIMVMHEIGFDISGNRANSIDDFMHINFDYIITVCANADKHCPIFLGTGIKVHIPFDDPADAQGTEEEIVEQFRKVRDQIKSKMVNWLISLTDTN